MKYLSFVSFFYTVFKEQAERVFFDDSLKTEQYFELADVRPTLLKVSLKRGSLERR